ncbi:MAG: undecaprenyl-diphosphatase UppP [Desulfuromonadales bacterium]|nr:undecaprenyl-diphosphatase UppP [Desulfuromonadales bacterium]
MTLFDAILLGIIQGITEFLPISSDGHLAIAQHYLPNFGQPGLLFDVMLHVGTLGAMLLYFQRDVVRLLVSPFRRTPEARRDRRLLGLIVVASVPTAIIGLALKNSVERWMENMVVVGAMLILTGTLLFIGERYRRAGRRGETSLTVTDAVLTGIAQGLAVLPGLSRSGSTIATLLFRGVDGEAAARFSFLMAMPAIAGAALLSLKDLDTLPAGDISAYLAGTAVAFLVGLFAIRLLLDVIRRQRLVWFSIYCWLIGAALLGITL